MLQEIVSSAIETADDLTIIVSRDADASNEDGVADVIFISAEQNDLDATSLSLLSKYPRRSVLILNNAAAEFHTYELRFHHEQFSEPSVTTLIDGIRSSAARRLTEDRGDD